MLPTVSMETMTICECPLAGYCKRHKLSKPIGWHTLCQTNESYFEAWEQGRGPGQAGRNPKQESPKPKQQGQSDERKEQRRRKVEAATRRKQRLIGWLRFFRLPTDRGVGDTAARLRQQQPKSPVWVPKDATHAVKSLLSQCSCSRTEAVTKLNEQYPY